MRRAISIIILAVGLAACAGAPAPGGTGAGTNAATLVGTPTTQPTDDVDMGAKAESVLDYLKTHYLGSLPGEAVTGQSQTGAVMSAASGREFAPKAVFEKQHVVKFDRMVATVYPGATEVPFEIDEKSGELSSEAGSAHALHAEINWLAFGVVSEWYPLRITLDGQALFEVEEGAGEAAIQGVIAGPLAPFLKDTDLRCIKNEARVKHYGRFGIGGSISVRGDRGGDLVQVISDWCDAEGSLMEAVCDASAELGYSFQRTDIAARPELACEGRKLVGRWTDEPVAFSLLALDICMGQSSPNCSTQDISDLATLPHAGKFDPETLGTMQEYQLTPPKVELP